jgi:hypothetical protein
MNTQIQQADPGVTKPRIGGYIVEGIQLRCAKRVGWSDFVKVFLSYGHDQNTPIVDWICRDLEACGHEVWIDKSKIKAGQNWRRSIFDGLSDTDWVLAFLSRHSVRDPGVCLDEIGIALHAKGGAIATVLVENDAKVEPPISVSQIQWFDMRDWAERQAKGGPEWDSWYSNRRGEILALLANPDVQRFAGEIKELDGLLVPVSQQGDIGALVDGFVGRAWLQRQVDEWRQTAKDSRLLWISGSAGTGKSAFAAWLGHHGKVNVIALNLCAYNKEDRRDASRVLCTLAFQIATRLPVYRRLMLDRLKTQHPEGGELGRKSPAALFSFLLVEPLRLSIDGGQRGDRYLIVIDGLDETLRDGHSDLTEVLAAEAQKLPPWMAIVVTSRPEEPILRQFAGLKPVLLVADSPENMADIESYLRGWLPSRLEVGPDPAPVVAVIAAASEGNFLYVSKLREAVDLGTLSLSAPEGLPRGLVGLYERWFRHRFPTAEAYERYLPLLSVIIAAEHPVPEEWLTRLFGWPKRDAAAMLEGLGSLFERRTDGVAPFHKSLRDWLIDARAAGPAFAVDETDGSNRLTAALWAEFANWARQSERGVLDEFCVAELPAQMMRARLETIPGLLAGHGGWLVVRRGLFETAESLTARYAWGRALAWWRMTARLAEVSDDAGVADSAYASGKSGNISPLAGRSAEEVKSSCLTDSAYALSKSGDILLLTGRTAEALKSFCASLAINERLAKLDAGNAHWQRLVSVSHDRIGECRFPLRFDPGFPLP